MNITLKFNVLKGLAALSALAVAAAASAQSYTPPPYYVGSRSQTISVKMTDSSQPQYANRYLRTDASDIDSLPTDLTNFLATVNPYWSFGTDFNSNPEFMSSRLYTTPANTNTGVGGALQFDTVTANSTGMIGWGFSGRWNPRVDPAFDQPPYNEFQISGKNYWLVVVRKNPNGTFQFVGDAGAAPSHYSLNAGGNDDLNSNYFSGDYNTQNYTKAIRAYDRVTARVYANTRYEYYVMLCNWSVNGPYVGVNVRDAIKLVSTITLQPAIGGF